MNVKKCKKCGAEVNGELSNCPECGTSLQDSNRSYKKVVLFSLIVFNIFMIFWAFSGIGGSTAVVESANTVAGKDMAEKSTIFGGSMIAIVWIVGDIVLGILYFMSGRKS